MDGDGAGSVATSPSTWASTWSNDATGVAFVSDGAALTSVKVETGTGSEGGAVTGTGSGVERGVGAMEGVGAGAGSIAESAILVFGPGIAADDVVDGESTGSSTPGAG